MYRSRCVADFGYSEFKRSEMRLPHAYIISNIASSYKFLQGRLRIVGGEITRRKKADETALVNLTARSTRSRFGHGLDHGSECMGITP